MAQSEGRWTEAAAGSQGRCAGGAGASPWHPAATPPLSHAASAPASLCLAYGARAVGLDYDRSQLGMQLGDCRALARMLAAAETVVHLDLWAAGRRGRGVGWGEAAPRGGGSRLGMRRRELRIDGDSPLL
jgi:hypothetical protein